MKKTVFIVLAVIVALAVLVTAILLVQQQKNKEDSGEDVSPSPAVSAAVSPSAQQSEEPSESPSPSPSESAGPEEEESVTREETDDGIVYTVTVDESLAYRLTVDETVLSYGGNHEDGQTFQSPNPDNENYLKILFVEDTDSTTLAPALLNAYLAFTEFEQSGQEEITGTDITGEKIAVNDGQTQVEAWLIDTDGGVLAVVISYMIDEKDAQLAELDDVLASLEINEDNAEDWANQSVS